METYPPKIALKFGMVKGTFEMAEDFDEPLDALIIEKRKAEDSIPFDEFVKQLKDAGKLDS